MGAKFFDREDGLNALNGKLLQPGMDFVRTLDILANRPPFFYELVGEAGYNLLVGIGDGLGCIQYSSASGDPPYWMALGADQKHADGYVQFLIGGTSTAVSRRYVLDYDRLGEIQNYFLETGERSPHVSWEEV